MKEIELNIDDLDLNGQELAQNEQKVETIYDRLVDYGMLQYNALQIAKCEGMKKIDVEILLFKDEKAKMIYEKAFANAQFELDSKIMNLAMSGDIKAIAMHQDRLARAMMDEDWDD
jgi:hypothetical protein